MKKILLSISALALVLTANSQSTPRTVLLEHFTQASCGPCATSNPAIKNYLDNTTQVDIVQISYQTSWPGFDPMHLHNVSEVGDRVSKYNVTGVPNSVIDGGGAAWGGFNGGPIGTNFGGVPGWTDATFTNRASMMSPFEIELESDLSADLSTVNASLKITATDSVQSGSYVAYIVVIEKEIIFATAPGSNGETEFVNVMKKMLPNSTGASIAATWVPGDSLVINETWTASNVYDKSQLAVVAFIQKNNDEVMQSAEALTMLPAGLNLADISAVEAHTLPTDFCATSFIPEMTVTNNSATETIDTITVSYVSNGGATVSEDVFTTIAPGASYTHAFASINLNTGSNTIEYSVNTDLDLSTADLSSTNNTTPTASIYVLGNVAFDTEHEEGFESNADFDAAPSNAISVNPDEIDAFVISDASVGSGTDLGGYGASTSSYFWDFYTIGSGDESSIVWESLDFSNNLNTVLTWDHAYAQYSGENDRLKVAVSTDCGITWNEVFNEAGSSLTTAPSSSSRFWPTSSQWTTDSVNLSNYNGESTVMVRFTGESAYGNTLLVDNINMRDDFVEVDAISEVVFANVDAVKLSPNPATNVVTLDFSLMNDDVKSVELLNSLGQSVKNELVTSDFSTINVNDLSSGIYTVKIYTNNNNFGTKKLVVK